MRSAVVALALAGALIAFEPAAAQPLEPLESDLQQSIIGRGTAIKTGVLELAGRRIVLEGIDGLEFHQFCFVNGRPWACGAPALRALQSMIDGQDTECWPATMEAADGPIAARCHAGGRDVGGALVREGWALALPAGGYEDAEMAARDEAKGIWQSAFLPPSSYREHIAEIEANYLEALPDALGFTLTRALEEEPVGPPPFSNTVLTRLETAEGLSSRRLEIPDLQPGFIHGAIEFGEVFDWAHVTDALAAWEQAAIARLRAAVTGAVWESFLERPGRELVVRDAHAFYRALRSPAAAWREEGRQPVLLVRSALVPSWIDMWLNGNPPHNAQVEHKEGMGALYLGTLDGIDIHVGPTPDTVSVLVPDDLLHGIEYALTDQGTLLSVDRLGPNAAGTLALGFRLGMNWRSDTPIWLRYLEVEAESLNEL